VVFPAANKLLLRVNDDDDGDDGDENEGEDESFVVEDISVSTTDDFSSCLVEVWEDEDDDDGGDAVLCWSAACVSAGGVEPCGKATQRG